MLSRGLECIRECWNSFHRVRIPLYSVGMLSSDLECSLQCWNAFYRDGIPLYRVGMLSTDLEYLCKELECFLQG
jgi:hypothetical protein